METAKLEMELMKALDAGENIETKVNDQQRLVEQTKDAEQAWKLEVWQKMLVRIRKMESMLNQPNDPKS
ncbi:hypothetical protein [Synechococcus sp. BL107]|uniref:hypothetical protein n=2 Tax=Synechococcales TaxID=1890424 RepID=UPI001E487B5B|nr:hypothetical protein [Synechococcus sp. BL107]